MTDLLIRYQNAKKENPLSSSFVNFQHAITGMALTKGKVRKGFLEHVDRKDYDEADLDRLVDYLHERSNRG
jgi:hypothetical protein